MKRKDGLVWVGGLTRKYLKWAQEGRKEAGKQSGWGDFRTLAQHRMHQGVNCSHGASVCFVHGCIPGTWNSNPFCVCRLAQLHNAPTVHQAFDHVCREVTENLG